MRKSCRTAVEVTLNKLTNLFLISVVDAYLCENHDCHPINSTPASVLLLTLRMLRGRNHIGSDGELRCGLLKPLRLQHAGEVWNAWREAV